MRIIFATGNKGKLREIDDILKDLSIPIVSMKDAGITSEPDETGVTFEENAIIKAKHAADVLKEKDAIYMADDSGLEVDALGGEPGVYSARYMGEDTPYTVKNKNIIDRLDGVENDKRTARFVCAIAAVLPDGEVVTTRGTIEGKIGYEERGTNGFGYDPIFYLPDMSVSTAELSPDEKNRISHRGRALEAMKIRLKEILKQQEREL
ncbi:MAG: XTP/dITP diphosphatase [Candidatus Alectryocaccobium sp.]|jgi:XTP/dITP diphosphohydrolase|nr:XTP/dITP diphosphatase [Lachnospiraceae bacterium]MDY6221760.1 XTP/dITP diphosphatase [Candidatus Alectryocaccobium sp.]